VLHANVSPDFTPIRSELANARGFSRGLLNFVVLSADQPFSHAPAWTIVFVALLLSYVVSALRQTQGVRTVFLVGFALAFLAAVALSPFLTPYRVVLAPRTFALCLLLLCSARLARVGAWLHARWTPLLSGAVGAAFFASAMLQALGTYGGNYSGFLHVSREVAARAPFLQERPELRQSLIVYDAGYDGQFMYLMAFDPFLQRFKDRPSEYRKVVDTPPYRYGRIGFSLLTDIAAAGRPERYPGAMMWLIVAAHFALATLLARLAMRHGMSPFAGLWYLAIPGFTSSLMSALPEALAAAGIVAGFLCWEARRPILATLCFGAALLIRETGVALIVALVLTSDRQDLKRSALILIGSLAPVCAWRLFVAGTFFSDFGLKALLPSSGNLDVPFAGVLRFWQAVAQGTSSAAVFPALVYPLILIAALALAAWLFSIRRRGLELAALAYATLAICLDYVNHLPSVERTTFELFVCLLLLLLESKERPVWIRRTLTGLFVVLAAYTFFIAPDSGTSRAALLLIR
jgi:hypothetical protein